jgi:L-fuculose-phosphate aldolase
MHGTIPIKVSPSAMEELADAFKSTQRGVWNTMTRDPRSLMVEIAGLMYGRFLTNSAGGNVSCRVGDRIYITPRGLGSKHRWRLREEMILVLDSQLNTIEGSAETISRESRAHFACYQHFPEVRGVIHAHPRHLSVFAAAAKPVPPTLDYTAKFGETVVVPPLPSHSQELADAVVAALAPQQGRLATNGLGLILAGHGVLVVGRDLADAYDTLERLEWSAHVLLSSPALP